MEDTEPMKLISKGPGHWESEDGRVEIILDHNFETECGDEPHPVRIRLDSLSDGWYAQKLRERGKVTTRRTKLGPVQYLSYQCEGNEPHWYSMWTVRIDGEWTDNCYESFSQARGVVEAQVGPTILQRKVVPKIPRVEPTALVNDRRVWAVCGHPAERDALDGCYTCKRPLKPMEAHS